ncbi:unnamed protein product [Prunus brigantina]
MRAKVKAEVRLFAIAPCGDSEVSLKLASFIVRCAPSVFISTCFVLGRLKATESLAMVSVLPLHFHSWHCAVQVIVYAALYLKLRRKKELIRG